MRLPLLDSPEPSLPLTALDPQGDANTQTGAETATTGATGEGVDAEPPAPSWLPFILIGALFYFILIRPQSKEQKRRQEMLGALKKGDEVMTSGGLFGTVTALDEARVTLEVAKGVKLEFSRAAVQGLAKEGEDPKDEKS